MNEQVIYGTIVGLYLFGLAALAVYEYRKVDSASDYIVADGDLNSVVAGVSEVFSTNSGFWIIGMTGFAFVVGTWAWIALPVHLIGWILLYYGQAERLKRSSVMTGEDTIPSYLQKRFSKKPMISSFILLFSAASILIFEAVYVGSQVSAGAKALQPFFDINYLWAVLFVGSIVVVYTLSGGFLAVAWSDFIQGVFVTIGTVIMAYWGVMKAGGIGPLFNQLMSIDPALVSMNGGETGMVLLGNFTLWLFTGMYYFGVPHALVRFFAIDDSDNVRNAMMGSGISLMIVATSSLFIGLTARVILGDIQNTELAFAILATEEFPAIFAGFLLVSALGLIMSTADSQLLMSGTAFSRDIYEGFFGKDISDQRSKFIARVSVLGIGLISIAVAGMQLDLVLRLVIFAWVGLGSIFGPAIFATLWWNRTTAEGVLAGMVAGGVMTVVSRLYIDFIAWNVWPLVASTLVIIVVSLATETSTKQNTHIQKLRNKQNVNSIAQSGDD